MSDPPRFRPCACRFTNLRPLGPAVGAPLVVAALVLSLAACQLSESRPVSETAPAAAPQEAEAHSPGDAELAVYMSDLQRWSHKAVLSVEARNAPLADFYLHELEETVEAVQQDVPTYEGYAIAELTETMLLPSLDSLDVALDAGDWPQATEQLRAVATACNQCHVATDHGFVHIKLHDLPNPFAQSFDPQDLLQEVRGGGQ